MPRPRSLEPSYCLHKPSGLAYCRIAGKQVWLGKHNTQPSKDKHRAVVAEWVAKGRPVATDAPTPADSKCVNVGPVMARLIDPYWEHSQTYYRKHGRATDEQGCIKVVMRLLNRMYGELPTSQFDSLKVLAMREEMIRLGWARKTINDHIGRVKRFLRWSKMMKTFPHPDNYLDILAIAALEKGRSEAKETDPKKPVPQEHIDAVRPFLSRQVRAMIDVHLLCGARPGELVSMRKVDINRDGKVWKYSPREHKNEHHEHNRTIFFGANAQAILAPFLMRPDDAPVFSAAESARDNKAARNAKRKTPAGRGNCRGDVKTKNPKRPPGESFTVDSYRRAIVRACDKADQWAKGGKVIGNDERLIPRFHPHRLRHNLATSIRAKYGAEASKLAIGVEDLDTMAIYGERDLATLERIFGEVG